jgi:putative proteasome-type protease
MTFCVGIRVREGLVALADTQIVRGQEMSSKAKLSLLDHGGRPVFVMTSGLRSIRDKAVMRLEDELDARPTPFPRLYEVVTAFGDQLKRVKVEDGPSLQDSGLRFNSHAIIGGHLPGDSSPTLFMVYPEGNWIDATPDSPYFIIGRTSYGKPILDRLLTYDTPLAQAVALAYLAFDSTRASVVDVEFPIDLVLLVAADGVLHERRFTSADLASAHAFWHARLQSSLAEFPMDWAAPMWSGLPGRAEPDALSPDEEAVVEAGGQIVGVDPDGEVEVEGPNTA